MTLKKTVNRDSQPFQGQAQILADPAYQDQRCTLCLMPDFGLTPHIWQPSPHGCPPWVGANIADAIWLDDGLTLPLTLRNRFVDWAVDFEQFSDELFFNSADFHKRGIALAHELKQTVGDQYHVEYHQPPEDPTRRNWKHIRISEGRDGCDQLPS